jgi:hypothetical protein
VRENSCCFLWQLCFAWNFQGQCVHFDGIWYLMIFLLSSVSLTSFYQHSILLERKLSTLNKCIFIWKQYIYPNLKVIFQDFTAHWRIENEECLTFFFNIRNITVKMWTVLKWFWLWFKFTKFGHLLSFITQRALCWTVLRF